MIIPAGLGFSNFLMVGIIVAALYLTRDVLVPMVMAVLLAFVLAPLVKFLQRWHLPRPVAVLSTVAVALAVALSLATMVMVQVKQLADDLPRYQTTLSDKVHNFRDVLGSASLFQNASGLLRDLGKELEVPEARKSGTAPTLTQSTNGNPDKPIPVEVQQPVPGASQTMVSMLQPLVTPFTTTGIVVIFVTFFLFQREDLRNQFIRLAGSRDLESTTAALDDAGHRLGKLFATQLILNATFGFIIGAGLALIGVPSAPLWGLLAMILRFVPYIGALMAAVLPLTLSAAVGPDWKMALWTFALFAVVETLMGQVIEPFIYGRSAGLSPVAIVVSAAFWTWLWGPLGLLMSTPLTLCLVVLARHVDRLRFIDVMLGDQPALTPQQAAYQRMLTGDPIEAIEQAREFLKQGDVVGYYEEILIGALRLAQADAERGKLTDDRLENIFKTVNDLVEDLGAHQHGTAEATARATDATEQLGQSVFCIPGLGRLDDCAAAVVADVLRRAGINARISGADSAIEANEANSICLCYLESVTVARLDYIARKLSKTAAKARIVACLLAGQQQSAIDEASVTHTKSARSVKEVVAVFSKVPREIAVQRRRARHACRVIGAEQGFRRTEDCTDQCHRKKIQSMRAHRRIRGTRFTCPLYAATSRHWVRRASLRINFRRDDARSTRWPPVPPLVFEILSNRPPCCVLRPISLPTPQTISSSTVLTLRRERGDRRPVTRQHRRQRSYMRLLPSDRDLQKPPRRSSKVRP